MRKGIFGALALTVAALGPAACGDDAVVEAEDATSPDVEVSNARLMLPAVAGSQGLARP